MSLENTRTWGDPATSRHRWYHANDGDELCDHAHETAGDPLGMPPPQFRLRVSGAGVVVVVAGGTVGLTGSPGCGAGVVTVWSAGPGVGAVGVVFRAAVVVVCGFLGEQFALPVAVESLRALRDAERRQENARHEPVRIAQETIVSAADPLNLVGIILPGERVPAISGRSIVFRDGMPVEVPESFLRERTQKMYVCYAVRLPA